MTSCNVSMFIPLISAPLIKVESHVELDIELNPVVGDEFYKDQQHIDSFELTALLEAPSSEHFPLLI